MLFRSNAAATSQILAINANTSSTVTYQASASGTDGASWLSVSSASGQVSAASPSRLAVTADPSGLVAGVYSGVVNIAVGSFVRNVPVTLVVTGAAPSAQLYDSYATGRDASCTASKLALTSAGEIGRAHV